MEGKNSKYQPYDELLINYLSGSASPRERELALEWIHENEEHGRYFDELKDYFQLTKVVQRPSGFNKEEGWRRVHAGYYKELYLLEVSKNKKRNRTKIAWYAVPVAAAVLIAFIIGIYASPNWAVDFLSPKQAYNEVIVPLGAKSQIILSDGTKVWLNAGSKLRYPATFIGNTRQVYLEGEAFFDVTKMKRQFVVKTSTINIKVYGTQFNVKSYPEEEEVQTTLIRGSVAIEQGKGNNGKVVFLKPNQTAIFYKSNGSSRKIEKKGSLPEANRQVAENIVVVPENNPAPVTSWKDEQWVIAGEPLGDLVIKLERRYNVKITFANESLKRYKFTGTLANETFEQILKIIQLSAPVVFKIQNNHVVLSEDYSYKSKYDNMIHNQPMMSN